jgi:ribosomal protein S18 acetylase RimI-like enzyme
MNDISFVKLNDSRYSDSVKSLWKDIFGDDYDFIDGFYSAFPMEKVTFAALFSNEVVGIVNSLDVSASYQGTLYEGRYIYALALREDFRGRGIAKKLLSMAEGRDFTLLVPESENLFDMYRHLGYVYETQVDACFEEPHLFFAEDGDIPCDENVRALFKSDLKIPESATFSLI